MDRAVERSSPMRIAITWIIVLIPLGWGIVQSVAKSLPLFQVSAPTASPAPPP